MMALSTLETVSKTASPRTVNRIVAIVTRSYQAEAYAHPGPAAAIALAVPTVADTVRDDRYPATGIGGLAGARLVWRASLVIRVVAGWRRVAFGVG